MILKGYTMKRMQLWHISFGLICFFGLSLVASVDSNRNSHFDVLDEAAHYDYVLKLTQGDFPSWGEKYSPETLRISDCLGGLSQKAGNCSLKLRNPIAFAPQGFSYEVQQPPLGYVPFLVSMNKKQDSWQNLKNVRFWGNEINILLASILITLIISLMAFDLLASGFISMTVILCPAITHSYATVTNDGFIFPAMLFFLYLLLTVSKSEDKSRLLSVMAGLALGLTKGFLPAVPIVGFILVRRLRRREEKNLFEEFINLEGIRTFFRWSSMFSIGSFLVYTGFQIMRASVSSNVVLKALLGFSITSVPKLHTIVNSVVNMALPFYGNLANGVDTIGISLFITLFLAFMLGSAFNKFSLRSLQDNLVRNMDFQQKSLLRAHFWAFLLIRIYLFGALVIGLGWPLLVYMQGKFDFSAPSRYAIGLIPFIIFPIAIFIQSSRETSEQK